MRTLVVAEQYPWPALDGYRRRLDHLIRGLADAGEVEVVALHRAGAEAQSNVQPTVDSIDPRIPGVVELHAIPTGPAAGIRQWGPRWVQGGPPRRILGPDWSAVREHLMERTRTEPPIDLVWFSHVDTWWPLQDLFRTTPTIVDFDNLENLAIRLRRGVPPRVAPGSSASVRARATARWAMSRGFDLVDERRWDRVQHLCADRVDHVVVCSELDQVRSGCDNAVVIGNGADAPVGESLDTDRTARRGERPTLIFVGALDYEPNTEAVEWFVSEVLPRLRAELPDVSVRIVGRGAHEVAWVGEVQGVELVGPVDDIESELRRADAAIVPIRVGAGTRLKVVEALASHLPMVTTTVGCEGIDVRDDVHALIVDDAAGFADACRRLLTDPSLRQRLADAGAELFKDRYDWKIIQADVAALARSTVESHR